MFLRRLCLVVILVGSAVVGRAGCSHPVDTVRTSHPASSRRTGGTGGYRAPRAAVPTTTTEAPPDVHAALLAVSAILAVMFPPTTLPTPVAAPTTTITTVPAPVVAVTGDYHSWPDWWRWQRIGRCEQPNDAEADGIWWDRPGKYPGGLGILASSSASVGGSTRLDLEPPAEQIRVARLIQERYGWGAWSCARSFGW